VVVGGGSGGLSVAMAAAWSHLEITLTDLSSTAAVAERYIDEAGLRFRIRLRPTDIVTGRLEETYDVAIIRNEERGLSAIW
jgi:methylase of polypeptide subunit release factors